MRSKAGYWIGGVVAVVGIAAAVTWVVLGFVAIDDRIDALQRVPVPGSGTVQLDEGRHAVYYERTQGEGHPAVRVEIVHAGSGRAVQLENHSSEVTYDWGGHSGVGVFGFDAPADGIYRVRAAAPGARAGDVLAVGEGIGSGIVRTIVVGVLLFVAGPALGALLVLLTYLRRRRAARTATPA